MKIHTVKTRYANATVISYDDEAFVVDVAARAQRFVLGFVVETLELPVETIKLVACTHDDPDHMGGVAELAALCGAQLAVPYASGEAWHKMINDPFGGLVRIGTGFREAFRARNRAMYLNPERDAAAQRNPHYKGDHTEVDHTRQTLRLKDGDRLPGFADWEIIHTPGHSWDSCCYFHHESGSLISGDTLLVSRKQARVVRPAIYANRRHFARTLDTLRALDIRAIYPGHGMVIEGADLLNHV